MLGFCWVLRPAGLAGQVNAKRQYVSVEWDSGDYAPLLYVGQKQLFQLATFHDPFSSADDEGRGGGGEGGEGGGHAHANPDYLPSSRQERGRAHLYASQTTTLQAEMSETQPSPPPSVGVSREGLSRSLSVVCMRPCVCAALVHACSRSLSLYHPAPSRALSPLSSCARVLWLCPALAHFFARSFSRSRSFTRTAVCAEFGISPVAMEHESRSSPTQMGFDDVLQALPAA